MPQELEPVARVAPAALAGMIDAARTALLVIDVQEDFASPSGAMGHLGIDLSGVPAALDCTRSLIAAARRAGATVGFARVVSSPESDSRALQLLMQRKGYPAEALAVCRDGTPGAAYYQVEPEPGDIEIAKRLFSSFVGTSLDADLKARGIDTLVVAGLTTDCCVDCTVRDAFHRNYSVFVVADACDAYDAALHRNSLDALQKNCALITDTAAVCAAWAPR